MAEIIVSHRGKKFFNVPLNGGKLSIGRSHHNDLILAGEDVSRAHAIIENRDGDFVIIDDSARGTLVNEEPCTKPRKLASHDKIRIAEWQLEFSTVSRDEDNDLLWHGLRKNTAGAGNDTKLIHFDENIPVNKLPKPLLIIESPEGRISHYPVRKNVVMLGSGDDCDVTLKDEYISSKHLLMSVTPRGFLITDLDSTNGTVVNGAKIRELALTRNEELLIGRSKIMVRFKNNEERPEQAVNTEFCGMVGRCAVMRTLFSRIERVATTEMTVLIRGETGTGKEMVARAVHDLSARRDMPYVILNCGAISTHLIESELFGHEKGAFTGAVEKHAGAFEQAHTGTIFLDELGELPLELQSKILRVLEYQSFRRVGGTKEIPVNVRIIAATHQNLSQMALNGQFREDLLYRLFVLPLSVAPLRERGEDLDALTKKLLAAAAGGGEFVVDESAREKIRAHDWPGNVRELKNTLMRALAFCRDGVITADSIEFLEKGALSPLKNRVQPALRELTETERLIAERIRQAVMQTRGDKEEAARLLGIGRSTLFRKIREMGIDCQ